MAVNCWLCPSYFLMMPVQEVLYVFACGINRTVLTIPRCSIREQDWHILAGFWHPVAFEHDLGDEPQSVKLLDVDLVLYKTSDGITVARDRCPHRVKVSLGRVIDDCLVCPMQQPI